MIIWWLFDNYLIDYLMIIWHQIITNKTIINIRFIIGWLFDYLIDHLIDHLIDWLIDDYLMIISSKSSWLFDQFWWLYGDYSF